MSQMGRRESLRILAAAGVSLGMGGGLVRALLRRGALARVERTEPHMGTLVTLVCVHPDATAARNATTAAFQRIAALEGVLSRHNPMSAVGCLNRTGSLIAPPPVLVEVLEVAQQLSVRTDGAFDVTIAPLLNLYAARFANGGSGPLAAEVEAARARVDYRALEVSADRVDFARNGMAITLDGIAKGTIVDRTVAGLVARGFEEVLVEAGGDIGSAGRGPDGLGWPVGVDVPMGPARVAPIHLRGSAVATSGDAPGSFTEDRATHHIIDPRTGRSPTDLQAASIRAPTAMAADALSTAVMVLGMRAGLTLLAGEKGAEGLLVDKRGRPAQTSAW